MRHTARRPVRFAVVGVQGYSRSHLAGVRSLAEANLGRLAASTMIDAADHPDIVAEMQADGVRVFVDYEDMLASCHGDVDVVTLPVPIHLHAPMSIAALEAGYHVLVEKPLAGCVSEVDRMIAARDTAGRQCFVGFQWIYSPAIQTLKRRIVEGAFGRVGRISIMALWPRGPAYYGRNRWAGKLFCDGCPVYDSPFNNALAHQIMNLLYLASPTDGQAAVPANVQAELYRAYDIESFDTGCLRVQTTDGVELVFAATHACHTNVDPVVKLEAEHASFLWDTNDDLAISYADGRTETIERDDLRKHLFANVVDVLSEPGIPPLCPLEVARAHVACIEAVNRVAPIVNVSPDLVSETDGGQRVITGVEAAVRQSFATGQLFSELKAAFVPH